MRWLGKVFVLLCLTIAVAGMVVGQPPGGGQPGFGGKGKGAKGPADYMTLLSNNGVKTELKLTDEQLQKLPAALLKQLAEVLSDKQLQRLREIYVQQLGNAA